MSEPKKVLSYEFDGAVLTISDGDTTLRTFDFDELPTSLESKFLELGRKTKLANFAASAKSLGKDRLDMIDDGWSQLVDGVWEKEREGGGPTVSAEVEALAELKGISVAAAQKALRGYDAETRKKILSNPKIKAKADAIRAAKSAESVDLADLT